MFQQLNLHDASSNLISLTNIPIYIPQSVRIAVVDTNTGTTTFTTSNYVVSYYTPSVHRILQLAANMFEATTTTNNNNNALLYPSIYRPYFNVRITSLTTNVTITGYEQVNGPQDKTTDSHYLTDPLDLSDGSTFNALKLAPANNVYGVPWIIGARKGFPNLNVIAMQSVAQITRKLWMSRKSTDIKIAPLSTYETRQMLLLGVSNSIGVEVWNSYSNAYPTRPVRIQADGRLIMTLTNEIGFRKNLTNTPLVLGGRIGTNLGIIDLTAGQQWQGTGRVPGINSSNVNALSFQIPLLTNVVFLSESAYISNSPYFIAAPAKANFSQNWKNSLPVNLTRQPLWGLNITNRIRCMILDGGANGRVVDYVQLDGLNTYRDLTGEIYTNALDASLKNIWSTNFGTGITVQPMSLGIISQIQIASGGITVSDDEWKSTALDGVDTRGSAMDNFEGFLYLQDKSSTNLTIQVPFTPSSVKYQPLIWQANDPLVHYTLSDLTDLTSSSNVFTVAQPTGASQETASNFMQNFRTYTARYNPWGGNPKKLMADPSVDANMALKDPLVRSSDDWDFPTNKLPNIGWLGRVHRGTPWQTVYLKATDITNAFPKVNWLKWNWVNWTGDASPWPFTTTIDAFYNRPVQDRLLFDSFTTAINENATRGQLSVNQTNLAAWSAILSGVLVITNDVDAGTTTNIVIAPAGIHNPQLPFDQQTNLLVRIWQGINSARANTNLIAKPVFPNHVFNHLGDILATTNLTEASPFLNFSKLQANDGSAGGLTDEIIERIPQQIMGLLTLSHSPRFVIYSYGQTLHPAERSIYTGSGLLFGLCTNYQVTAEAVTRAVLRVDGSFDSTRTPDHPDPFGNFYPPRITVEEFNVLPAD
jgi:hypothetical protein